MGTCRPGPGLRDHRMPDEAGDGACSIRASGGTGRQSPSVRPYVDVLRALSTAHHGHRLRRPGAAGRMSDGTADTGPGSADRGAGLHVACEIVKPPEGPRRKVSTSGGPDLERIFSRAGRDMAAVAEEVSNRLDRPEDRRGGEEGGR